MVPKTNNRSLITVYKNQQHCPQPLGTDFFRWMVVKFAETFTWVTASFNSNKNYRQNILKLNSLYDFVLEIFCRHLLVDPCLFFRFCGGADGKGGYNLTGSVQRLHQQSYCAVNIFCPILQCSKYFGKSLSVLQKIWNFLNIKDTK